VVVDCEEMCNFYEYITFGANNKIMLATLAFDLLIMNSLVTECLQARPEFVIEICDICHALRFRVSCEEVK
jgi:hypothetical protein